VDDFLKEIKKESQLAITQNTPGVFATFLFLWEEEFSLLIIDKKILNWNGFI
jgi:hypothetical protein